MGREIHETTRAHRAAGRLRTLACLPFRAYGTAQGHLATLDGTRPASNGCYVIRKNKQNDWSKRELACISRSGAIKISGIGRLNQ
jgi:hypothetical protein